MELWSLKINKVNVIYNMFKRFLKTLCYLTAYQKSANNYHFKIYKFFDGV